MSYFRAELCDSSCVTLIQKVFITNWAELFAVKEHLHFQKKPLIYPGNGVTERTMGCTSEAHSSCKPGSITHSPLLSLHNDKLRWSKWGLRVIVEIFVTKGERISLPVWDSSHSLCEPHL